MKVEITPDPSDDERAAIVAALALDAAQQPAEPPLEREIGADD